MTDKDTCIKIITENIQKQSQVIVLNGRWGTGKTYLWKNDIAKELKTEDGLEKKTAYISLFDKKDMNEIKHEATMSIYLSTQAKSLFTGTKRFISKAIQITEANAKIQLAFLSLDALISVLGKKDLKGSIVCFDDLERADPNLDFNIFFGYVAQLVEDKKCSVLLIKNEDEFSKNIKALESYNKFKEKIIDFEIEFTSTPKNAFDIACSMVGNYSEKSFTNKFNQELFKIIQDKDERNIRIIKKSLTTLHDFSVTTPFQNLSDEATLHLLKQIFLITMGFWKFGKIDTDYDVSNSHLSGKNKGDTEERPQHLLRQYINNDNMFVSSVEIAVFMNEYCSTNIISENMKKICKNYINNIQEEMKQEKWRKEHADAYRKYRRNIGYSKENMENDILNICKAEPDNLYKYLGHHEDDDGFIQVLKIEILSDDFKKEFIKLCKKSIVAYYKEAFACEDYHESYSQRKEFTNNQAKFIKHYPELETLLNNTPHRDSPEDFLKDIDDVLSRNWEQVALRRLDLYDKKIIESWIMNNDIMLGDIYPIMHCFAMAKDLTDGKQLKNNLSNIINKIANQSEDMREKIKYGLRGNGFKLDSKADNNS